GVASSALSPASDIRCRAARSANDPPQCWTILASLRWSSGSSSSQHIANTGPGSGNVPIQSQPSTMATLRCKARMVLPTPPSPLNNVTVRAGMRFSTVHSRFGTSPSCQATMLMNGSAGASLVAAPISVSEYFVSGPAFRSELSGVQSGTLKQMSISLSARRGSASSQSLASLLLGCPVRSGSRTMRMVAAVPCSAVAAASAFFLPALSAPSRISTSRPASALTHSSVHLPPATVVAQRPRSDSVSVFFALTHEDGGIGILQYLGPPIDHAAHALEFPDPSSVAIGPALTE